MWDIESANELLRDMCDASHPHELFRLNLGHVQRSLDLERALVLIREGRSPSADDQPNLDVPRPNRTGWRSLARSRRWTAGV